MLKRSGCVIVGVGVGAGPLDPLRRLLLALPADAPVSLLVVAHEKPQPAAASVATSLADIALPVVSVHGGEAVEPGRVYVVPEGREAYLADGVVHLRRGKGPCAQPIDALFSSLASHSESLGCGVLLASDGADGVQGLREIRGAGGIAYAQAPEGGAATGAQALAEADFTGSPQEIAAELLRRGRQIGGVPDQPAKRASQQTKANEDRLLAKVLELVRKESGIDFSGYKRTTVLRRIGRRAILSDSQGLERYLSLLDGSPQEVAALADDLLIGVTSFLRDPEVFEALRSAVLPKLLEGKSGQDAIRVWIAGCSTGEEVYSTLITVLESMRGSSAPPRVTIFGTDASEKAIRVARAGRYPATICTSVSQELLDRYFTPCEGGFEVARDLREMCVFARQDITRDTPFSRIDLMSLRNVLIYMEPELQRKVLAVAHYALAPGGFLVLGTSESPDRESPLFLSFDKQHHVFRRKDVASRLPLEVTRTMRVGFEALTPELTGAVSGGDSDTHADANELTLALYGPPRVVVDADGRIVHFFGDTSPYLDHPEGRATLDLLEMVDPALLLDVKEALEISASTGESAAREVTFAVDGEPNRVSVEVTPLPAGPGDPHRLVAFRDLAPIAKGAAVTAPGHEDLARLYEGREERLRRELSGLRGRVRRMGEESEVASRGLRAANEEARSSNEELQSINEELETAREELQSANEELITLNDDLRRSNRDLALANDDLANIMSSAEVPLLMLDRDLRVTRFTPQAAMIAHIAPADQGRLLKQLRLRVDLPDIEELVRGVIGGIEMEQREVRDEAGRWYSLQARPYRSADGEIGGAVLTFIDIDELKRSVERMERRARLSAALTDVDASIAAVLGVDEIMQTVLRVAGTAIGAESATLVEKTDGGWVVRGVHGLSSDVQGLTMTDAEQPLGVLALRTRGVVQIDDLLKDGRVKTQTAHKLGIRAAMIVPLFDRERPFGALFLNYHAAPHAFTPSEIEYGARLGVSLSLALSNARLQDAERRAARLSATLNEVNEILRTALTPDEVTERLVGEASVVAGADKSLIIEVRGDTFTITHVRGVRDDIVGVEHTSSYFPAYARAAQERRPLLIADTWNDARTNKDFVVPYELRAFMLMPLTVGDEVVAIVAFAYDEPRTFDAEDERFAAKMAIAMSLALRNARVYAAEVEGRERARKALETTDLLLEASLALAEWTDLATGLDRLIKIMLRAVPHTRTVIYGREAGADLRVLATGGEPVPPVGTVLPLASMTVFAREVLGSHRPSVVDFDALAADERGQGERFGVHLLLGVPLVFAGQVTGAIVLDDPGEPRRPFDRTEISVVEGFAAEVATAIQNATLFEAEQERRRRTQTLNEVLERVSSSLETGEVAEEALRYVSERLGVDVITLWAVNESRDRLYPVTGVGFPQEFYEGFAAGVGLDDPYEVATAFREMRPVARGADQIEQVPEPVRAAYERYGVPLGALLVLPVRGRTHSLGAITLAWREPRELPSHDVGFFSAVIESVAVGLENARLFAAEQDALTRTTVLKEVAAAAAATLDVKELADATLDVVRRLLGATTGNLFEIDEEAGVLRGVTNFGIPAEALDLYHDVPLNGDTVSARVALTGQLATHDAQGIPDATFRVRQVTGAAGSGWIILPVRARDRRTGVLGLSFESSRPFSEADVTLYQSLADQLGVGMEKAHLYEAERKRRELALALDRIGRLIHSTLESDAVMQSCLEEGVRTLGVDAGLITVHEAGSWVVRHEQGLESEDIGLHLSDADAPNAARAAATKDAFAVADMTADESLNVGFVKAHGLRSVLALPLVVKEVVTGCLLFYTRDTRRDFDDAEMDFGRRLATSLALSLTNSDLFESERRELERTRLLQAAAVAASSSLDVHEVCQRVMDEVRRLPEIAAAAFHMLDTGRNVLVQMCMSGYPEDMGDFMRELPVDSSNNPGRVIASGLDVLTQEDPGNDPSVAKRLAHMGIPDARWIALPAKSAGTVVGSLGLIFHGVRSFTLQEVRLFQGLAATVGTALANARLFAEVEETSARLSDILTSMTDGFVALDRDWRYTWMNSMAEEIIHRPAKELLGRSLLEEFPDIEGIAHYRRVMEQRVPEIFETFSEPAGTWLEVRAYPMGDGMSIFFADISERKAAEQALAQSRARADMLASVLENAAQPFGVGTPGGDLLLTNRAFERLTGYTTDELARISWADTLTPPEYAEFEAQQLALVTETGESVRYEKEYVRKDGTRVPVELLVHAMKDDAGQLQYYYSFVTDLTQRKAAEAAIEAERARLREIIEEVPMGIALVDANGAVLELNAANDRIWAGGLPRAESVAGFQVYKGYQLDNGEPMAAEDWPAPRVIATGKAVQEVVEIERFDGERRPVRISAKPILDRAGALSRVVVVTEDVSQEFERERLAGALNEIGAAITSTLDYEEVLHRVTKLAAEALNVETGSLTVRDRGEWVMRESVSSNRRKVSSALEDACFAQTLTESGGHAPIVIDDVETDTRVDAAEMRRLGIRSLMAVPIVAQQRVVGALVFHHRTARATFSAEQVDFAERLMAIVTLALENARLYGRELTIANTLQEAILTPPESVEGFEVDYLYRPASETANVGGDFYDVFHIDASHVAVVIGDISGKGIEAARLTSLLRDGVRAYALQGSTPAELLGGLNTLVHRSSPVEAYATMFFGVLEPHAGVVRYCTAGHPSPAVIGAGGARFLESTRSPILGAFENATFSIGQTTIEPGETLVMFTDGVTEARKDGEQFGESRLLPALQKLANVRIDRMAETLLARVLRFTGDILFDDTVILCLHRSKGSGD